MLMQSSPISSFSFNHIGGTSLAISEHKSAWSVRSITILSNVIQTVGEPF